MGFLYSQLFVTPQVPTKPLDGQTLIITGSNTGLGYAAAVQIARLRPARLILAVRNLEKGEAARQKLVKELPAESQTAVDVWQLDMSATSSVLAFADRCKTDLKRLDAVSLNAGMQTGTWEVLEGHEVTIKVNVVSTFLLALALQPVLLASARKYNIRPRLSIVSSEVHAWATFAEKKTPQGKSIFDALSSGPTGLGDRYMTSKLIQVLLFQHLSGPLAKRDGDAVIWNILNPGFCHSEFDRNLGWVQWVFVSALRAVLARSTEVGGRPISAGIVAGAESEWQYMHDGVVADEALSSYVKSPEGREMGARLWAEFKALVARERPELVKDL